MSVVTFFSNTIQSTVTLLESITKTKKTPLSKAILKGDRDLVQKIFDSMVGKKIELNELELWQIKVVKNLDFKDEEFQSLQPEMKKLIYRTANQWANLSFVDRLNSLNKDLNFLGINSLDNEVRGPSIISLNMDVVTIDKICKEVLGELRRDNNFLTKNEFDLVNVNSSWISKGFNFTRILGRNYLSKLVKELDLSRIKIPEKKVVFKSSDISSLTLRVSMYGDLINMHADDIEIFAEKITKVKRFLTREEVNELLTIMEKSNFSDMFYKNFIITEYGIYLIDTEFKSFSGTIDWQKAFWLSSVVSDEDQSFLKEAIEKKIKNQSEKIEKKPISYFEARNALNEGFFKGLMGNDIKQYENIMEEHKLLAWHNFDKIFTYPLQDILDFRA